MAHKDQSLDPVLPLSLRDMGLLFMTLMSLKHVSLLWKVHVSIRSPFIKCLVNAAGLPRKGSALFQEAQPVYPVFVTVLFNLVNNSAQCRSLSPNMFQLSDS